jgi:hypothetical protein
MWCYYMTVLCSKNFITSKFSPCSIRPWICKVNWSIVPCILRWHYTEVCGHIHALLVVASQKQPQEPFKERLSGPLSQSGCCRDRTISCYYQELNPDILVIHSVGELFYSMTYLGHIYKKIKLLNVTQGNVLLKVKPATK